MKNWFSSNLAQYGVHSSEASFGGDTAVYLVGPSNLSFVSLYVFTFLERQIKKMGDFLMFKGKENRIFSKTLKVRIMTKFCRENVKAT